MRSRNPYSFYVPIAKAYDSQDGKSWVFEAPLSNPDRDLQQERMNVAGLKKGLEVFRRLEMPIDWDHLWEREREPKWLIGKGLDMFDAPHPKTQKIVPWVRGMLYKDKEIARQAKEHHDSGGSLGISVAGQVVSRDSRDPKHIMESMVTSIALTPVPVVSENVGTVQFLKSLAAAAEFGPERIRFPFVPQLYDRLVPAWSNYTFDPGQDAEVYLGEMRKALEATGALPHAGPGAGALELEDVGGPEAGRRKKPKRKNRRKRDEREAELLSAAGSGEAFKKAFDQVLAGRLRLLTGR